MSTRRVDDLVRAMGIDGISRSEVSRICAALDADVERFRCRPLGETAFPYLWLDATYLKVREAGRVVSMAALVAVGVATTGERRILGLELSAGNDEGSAWPAFIRGLVERGLRGVRLVISDDHAGLVKAVPGAARLGLAAVPGPLHPQRPGPRAALGAEHGRLGHPVGVRAARRRLGPGAARPGDRLHGPAVPARSPSCSPRPSPTCSPTSRSPRPTAAGSARTNPLERLNKEIKRRTGVVGIFPNRASVIRLVGMVLAEQDDEWQDGRRYFRPETMTAIDAVADRGGGPAAPARELISPGARTTRCYTTCWDLTRFELASPAVCGLPRMRVVATILARRPIEANPSCVRSSHHGGDWGHSSAPLPEGARCRAAE